MKRTDIAGWALVVVLTVASLIWAVVEPWEVPDFSGARFEFEDPTCDDWVAMCASPVAR